jgi:hypothetical protein
MTDQSVPWPENHYHAYLVRLWQDRPEHPWRVLVRDCDNDEERRFNTVEQLFLFLHRQTEGRGTAPIEGVRP